MLVPEMCALDLWLVFLLLLLSLKIQNQNEHVPPQYVSDLTVNR